MTIVEFITDYWELYLFIGYWFSIDAYREVKEFEVFFPSKGRIHMLSLCGLMYVMWPARLIGMIRGMQSE